MLHAIVDFFSALTTLRAFKTDRINKLLRLFVTVRHYSDYPRLLELFVLFATRHSRLFDISVLFGFSKRPAEGQKMVRKIHFYRDEGKFNEYTIMNEWKRELPGQTRSCYYICYSIFNEILFLS